MNLEILNQNKLKVDLGYSDLDKYNLDYLSISTDSPGTKRMLNDILFEARETVGFSAKNCKLLIEVLPGKANSCILYLTKMPVRGNLNRCAHISEPYNAGSSYILTCNSIEDAIGATNCFARYPDIPLKKSSLYNFTGRYLLTFSPLRFGLDNERLDSLLASLSEYGEIGRTSPVKEAIIAEHGCTINDGRAVESFIRYFH